MLAGCRAFGVAILTLSLGAGATRHEHPAAFLGVRGAQELRVGMVPSAISRAIQHALRDSRSHLKALTAAEQAVTRLDPALGCFDPHAYSASQAFSAFISS